MSGTQSRSGHVDFVTPPQQCADWPAKELVRLALLHHLAVRKSMKCAHRDPGAANDTGHLLRAGRQEPSAGDFGTRLVADTDSLAKPMASNELGHRHGHFQPALRPCVAKLRWPSPRAGFHPPPLAAKPND